MSQKIGDAGERAIFACNSQWRKGTAKTGSETSETFLRISIQGTFNKIKVVQFCSRKHGEIREGTMLIAGWLYHISWQVVAEKRGHYFDILPLQTMKNGSIDDIYRYLGFLLVLQCIQFDTIIVFFYWWRFRYNFVVGIKVCRSKSSEHLHSVDSSR